MGTLKGRGEPDDVAGHRCVLTGWLRRTGRTCVGTAAGADRCTEGVCLRAHPEADWLEEDWRSAIRQARWVVARTAHDVIGVARSSREQESPERRYIEAVWVAPEFRRLGVGSGLVQWLIDREQESGIKEILLWVIDSNDYARGFYLRMGFRSTGRIQAGSGPEKNRTEELFAM